MEHIIQNGLDGKTVFMSGRVTSRDFEAFKDLLALFDGDGAGQVVFDLSNVEFMDSTALGMILLVKDKARSRGAGFSLQGVKGQVKRLFEIVKLGEMAS